MSLDRLRTIQQIVARWNDMLAGDVANAEEALKRDDPSAYRAHVAAGGIHAAKAAKELTDALVDRRAA